MGIINRKEGVFVISVSPKIKCPDACSRANYVCFDSPTSLSLPLIGDTGLYHIKLRENTTTEGCFKILKYTE
ncbi:hypothetical protein SO802_032417 [Lithocarpus litseifolius]|uniref:Uncharacterized protein n=1 Tax=Lithocarpus litseifolius TaxID=425828 RepID=A0AAW2BN38_9ROSI